MKQMGFGQNWHNWIRIRVSSPSFLVLVDGTSKGFFFVFVDFLFITVARALGRLVQKAEEASWLKGFKVGSDGVPISLIQLASDSLFLLEEELECFQNLRCI